MDTLLWIAAIAAASAFALAGGFKLFTPHARLVDRAHLGWARDYSSLQVKAIGLLELLGAAGLVLPPLLDLAEGLVPLAAAGLALDMLGAYSTHVRRADPRSARVAPIVLGVLAASIAVGRYWIEPF